MPMHGPNPCDGCGVQHTHVRSYITEDGRPVDHSGDPRRVFEATVRTVIGHGRPTRFITINVGDLLREQAFWGWFLDQTPDGGWADLATDGQLTLTFGHHPAEMRICVECGTTTDEYERLGRFMTDEGRDVTDDAGLQDRPIHFEPNGSVVCLSCYARSVL